MKQLFPKWIYTYLHSYITIATSVVLSLFTLGSLFTFHSQDPSWWHQSTQHMAYHNMFEGLGAYYAAFLLYMFGRGCYVLVPFFAYLALFFYFHSTFKKEWDRFAGWLLLLTSSCLFCYAFSIASFQLILLFYF